MTDISKLRDLLERVESATGPDRGLDCDIFCATAESPFVNYYPDCVLASLGGFAARVEIADIDKYTSSIDAAVALCERVLQGWRIRWQHDGDGVHHAFVENKGDFGAICAMETESFCETGGLAICAAILRAKLAMLEKGAE